MPSGYNICLSEKIPAIGSEAYIKGVLITRPVCYIISQIIIAADQIFFALLCDLRYSLQNQVSR